MYTVVVQRTLALPPAAVWEYLVQPERLALWFADSAAPLGAGRPFRFELGDGDYHEGRVTELEPGISLGLEWTFVGLGPTYRIDFSLLRRGDGTQVSVRDRGALIEPEAECLRVGWTEFLMRLEKAAVGGRRARFAWRKMITFTARLDDGGAALAAALADPAWYRSDLGVEAEITGGAGSNGERGVRARLRAPSWRGAATELSADFRSVSGRDYLFVVHEGWGALPAGRAPAERRAFVERWRSAVGRHGGR